MTFIEPASRRDLPILLTSLGLTGVGVEVGTYAGDYAAHLLTYWPGTLHCVDPYQHQSGWEDLLNHDAEGFAEVQARAEAQLAPWMNRGHCVLHVCSSIEAASEDWARDLDFVYLDARHDYGHVMQDLVAWYPRVKLGGLIGGHDYLDGRIGPTLFEVKRAVQTWARHAGYGLEEILVTQDGTYPSWFLRVREVNREVNRG